MSQITQLAASYQNLSDAQLQAKTATFRQDLQARNADSSQQLEAIEERLRGDLEPEERERLNDRYGELDNAIRDVEAAFLEEIMPEAFAMVVETCRRLLGHQWDRAGEAVEWDMVPYDVQIFGGISLHQGKIAEMATGEGKTLVATMPLFLNAIPQRGVHLVTHNEYLAPARCHVDGADLQFLGDVRGHHPRRVSDRC